MGIGATGVAASLDDNLPGVSELLSTGSFQERLEKARLQRASVLALSGNAADTGLGLKAPHKPWETAVTPPPGDQRKVNAGPDDANAVAATLSVAVAKISAKPDEPMQAVSPVPSARVIETVTDQSSVKRKFRIAKISGGFILGLVIGGGLMWLAPRITTAILAAGIFEGSQTAVVAAPSGDAGVAPPRAGSEILQTPGTTAGANFDGDPVLSAIADDFAHQLQPSVLTASAIRLDQPVALPEPPLATVKTASVAPVLAAVDAPETDELSGPAVGYASVDITYASPAALAVFAENADIALGAQPLPVAFTPADAMSHAAQSPVVGGPQVLDSLSVHVLAPQSVPEDSLAAVSRSLRDAGYKLVESARVPFTVKERQVRFYHEDDAEAARALANTLGASARDFTTFDPLPPAGIVEVWLADEESVTAATKNETPPQKKKKKPKAATKVAAAPPAMSEDQQLLALRDRLLAQLQSNSNP